MEEQKIDDVFGADGGSSAAAGESQGAESIEQRRERFLQDLTALTYRYGIEIAGCGCCNSPFLLVTPEGVTDRVYYLDNNGHVSMETQKYIDEWSWLGKED